MTIQMTISAPARITSAATAFVQFEDTELSAGIMARIALAVLRQQADDKLADVADAINAALQATNGASRRYWLQPNGEKVRTTKHLKSHHKRYWLTAGKLIAATTGKADVAFTALPDSLEPAALSEWIEVNGLAGATVDMLDNAVGLAPKNGAAPGKGKGKADGDKQPTAAARNDAPAQTDAPEVAAAMAYGQTLESLFQGLANALKVGEAMPTDSNKALNAKIAHYEAAIKEVLGAMAPAQPEASKQAPAH
jgi:hypothetical protein